jgi:hypothetical protein
MRSLGKVSRSTKAEFCGNVLDGELSPNFHPQLKVDPTSTNPMLVLIDQTGQYVLVVVCP